MESREIVRKAIEFDTPPRLPFFLGGSWSDKLSAIIENYPNDVCDCWEMDRQENGWYFDIPEKDDWGCQWAKTDVNNMGQVVGHPLENWNALTSYSPPDPRNPFYFKRIAKEINDANDRYVVLTSHFNLFERLHMLHGFTRTLEDFYLKPEKIHSLIDMILEFKITHLEEAAKRFGEQVHGIFLTDDKIIQFFFDLDWRSNPAFCNERPSIQVFFNDFTSIFYTLIAYINIGTGYNEVDLVGIFTTKLTNK